MENKVYVGWAFTNNESEKSQINRNIYQNLINKFKVYRDDFTLNPNVNLDEYDVVIGRKACNLYAEYSILKNEPKLNDSELLLLCDSGNLCFGGYKLSDNRYRVNED